MFVIGCTLTGYRCLHPPTGKIHNAKHVSIETYVYTDFYSENVSKKDREMLFDQLTDSRTLIWSL